MRLATPLSRPRQTRTAQVESQIYTIYINYIYKAVKLNLLFMPGPNDNCRQSSPIAGLSSWRLLR